MADLNVTPLNTDLGAYYRQRKNEIMQKLYANEDARKLFTVVTGVQDEYVMTELEVQEMIQPYQSGWTPKGEVKFKPETIKVRPVKVDFPFTPKKLEATWLGYLKTNGSKPEEYPFVQYIYEQILVKVAREVNNVTINGVYVAPTTGTAGSAAAAFNGLLKVVTDAITASKITPITTGAITSSNVVDKIEAIVDGIPGDQRSQPLTMLMSPTLRTMYFRKRRGDFGSNIDYKAGEEMVDFTNVRIVSPTYMNASQRVIVTSPNNLLLLEDGVNEEENIIVQANRRELELMMDFKRGVGFGIIDGMVWTNDQA